MQAVSNTYSSKINTDYSQGALPLGRGKRMQTHFLHKAGQTLMLAASLLPLALSSASSQQYHVTDLGVLSGFQESYANQINNSGQVVGDSYIFNSSIEGSLWDSGNLTGLGSGIQANGINNSGQIAGYEGNDAIIWQNGSITNLGILSGDRYSRGVGIEDGGMVVGWSVGDTIDQAFFYGMTPVFTYKMIGLGTLGGYASWANAINYNAVISGSSYLSGNSVSHAFACNPHFEYLGHVFIGTTYPSMTDLNPTWPYRTDANGMNNNNLIVGDQWESNLNSFPVVWQFDQNTGSIDWEDSFALPYSDASYSCAANAINNNNMAVGSYWSSSHSVACLWDMNGDVWDLNTCIALSAGWHLYNAQGINDNGQIVGAGANPGGSTHGFLLTPIALSGMHFKYGSLIGGNKDTGTISLNYPAVFNTRIFLSSSNPAVVSVPASLTVRAGHSSAGVAAKTAAVSTNTTVTITATYNGHSVSSAITVEP